MLLTVIPLIFGSTWYISYLSSLYWPLESPTNVLYFHHWWYIKESGRMVEVKCRHICVRVCVFFHLNGANEKKGLKKRTTPVPRCNSMAFLWSVFAAAERNTRKKKLSRKHEFKHQRYHIFEQWASVCHGTTYFVLRVRVEAEARR